jgi:hypothetical protein
MTNTDKMPIGSLTPRRKDLHMAGFSRIYIAFNFVYSLKHKTAPI